ncbi:MAG: hypothetical protein M3O25_08985 [Actinomycetota bacterium]|nr:hypothetical protein [Actinomycetota bacterium]
MKSSPELWEMIDQPDRMHGLMCSLVGHATEIAVAEREPESRLVWEAASHPDAGRIEVEMVEKGWGTQVEVSVSCEGQSHRLEGWLDAVMEELSTPEKRPFEGIV